MSRSGASRSHSTPNAPGDSTRGLRSPIHVVAKPFGTRPSNKIFGALAEDEAGDETKFPATSPLFSSHEVSLKFPTCN